MSTPRANDDGIDMPVPLTVVAAEALITVCIGCNILRECCFVQRQRPELKPTVRCGTALKAMHTDKHGKPKVLPRNLSKCDETMSKIYRMIKQSNGNITSVEYWQCSSSQ